MRSSRSEKRNPIGKSAVAITPLSRSGLTASIASQKIPIPSSISRSLESSGGSSRMVFVPQPRVSRPRSRAASDDARPALGGIELDGQHQTLAADVHDGVRRVVAQEFFACSPRRVAFSKQVVFLDRLERERAHHRPSMSPPPKVDPRRFFSLGKTSEREMVAPTRKAFALAMTSGSIA